MNTAVFSTKPYDRRFLEAAAAGSDHALTFLEPRLDAETAVLADGHRAVCVFVNDELNREVIEKLAALGVEMIALRCAGYNNVDLDAAHARGVAVARVPAYSPHAVAEHTLALILSLNRRIHRAYNRVREGNFAIDGLMGFDLCGKTAGVVGTGRIGAIVARQLHALGCEILAHDTQPNADVASLGARYVAFEQIAAEADVLTLHCPLTPGTRHLIDRETVGRLKPGVMLVNTSRGALIDASALIVGLKSGRIGSVALDVYEEEAGLFFEDRSGQVLEDDVLARLLTFPNVLITSHQAFFTREAMEKIAETTVASLTGFDRGGIPEACRL